MKKGFNLPEDKAAIVIGEDVNVDLFFIKQEDEQQVCEQNYMISLIAFMLQSPEIMEDIMHKFDSYLGELDG